MNDWKRRLTYDPAVFLEESDDIAVRYAYEKDLLGSSHSKLNEVWQSKPAQAILRRQRSDGSWKYKSQAAWSKVDYNQYATFIRLADLIEKYRFNNSHPGVSKVADYFFQFLAPEGDIRGIYGNQTSPNYTAAILELLLKAGFEKDNRIKSSLDGLLALRQNDGGWALAFRTRGQNLDVFDLDETIKGDLSRPSSAMVTGVVLRALVAHPEYKGRPETQDAAQIVADSMFNTDDYADRKGSEYWTRFAFPFIYTDLVSALDSLVKIEGFVNHPKVLEALEFFESHQASDGSFEIRTTRGNKAKQKAWMTLAICRIYKRMV